MSRCLEGSFSGYSIELSFLSNFSRNLSNDSIHRLQTFSLYAQILSVDIIHFTLSYPYFHYHESMLQSVNRQSMTYYLLGSKRHRLLMHISCLSIRSINKTTVIALIAFHVEQGLDVRFGVEKPVEFVNHVFVEVVAHTSIHDLLRIEINI